MGDAITRRTKSVQSARRRLAPDARRREILAVALGVFSSGEYATVTVRDVAVRANVNSALVYYYFKSKEKLIAAVIGHAMEQAIARYRARTAEISDPKAILDEWFRVNMEFFAPLKQMARILIHYQSATSRHSLIDRQVRKFYETERGILRRCIAAGIARRIFKRLNPGVAAAFISAHLDGICFVSITRPWTNMRTFVRTQWAAIWEYLGWRGGGSTAVRA